MESILSDRVPEVSEGNSLDDEVEVAATQWAPWVKRDKDRSQVSMESLFLEITSNEAAQWAERIPSFKLDANTKSGDWIAYCTALNPYLDQ